MNLQAFHFEKVPLTFFAYKNRPAVIAQDLGRALRYGADGRYLNDVIRREWVDELERGVDLLVLEGPELADFKRRVDQVTEENSVSPRAANETEENSVSGHICSDSNGVVGCSLSDCLVRVNSLRH